MRNQLTECRRLGVRLELGVGVWAGLVEEKRPDAVVVATGAEPLARGGRRPRPNRCSTYATSSTARRPAEDLPPNTVVVIDEIGFHHATSVAELLADRGCQVEVVTNGMVVGQDLGITLDMEGWWARAEAKGIVQSTDLVPMGSTAGRSTCSTIRPVTCRTGRRTGWSSRSPAAPVEWLFHGSTARARRRADRRLWPRGEHTPVIDGERVGAAL